MNEEEVFYSIALTRLPGIGNVRAKQLLTAAGSATAVFQSQRDWSDVLPGLSECLLQHLLNSDQRQRIDRELHFIRKNGLDVLTYFDERYPSRLRECEDAPVVLFYKGTADLNALHVINMVGTRHATDYGKQLCKTFVEELKECCPDVLLVSGLAYGIDVHAHRAALSAGLPTVAVLAHGLDRIYPAEHRSTAAQMVKQGGLLTEFLSETNPDKYNFVSRNRIVAGMCDATVVVESAIKGGSLITAELAEDYHRDCFAFPGRLTDECSAGCNRLIRDNRAALLLSAEELVKVMGWQQQGTKKQSQAVQRSLFVTLSPEAQQVVQLLEDRGELQINSLVVDCNIPINRMNALLFELEMQGVVQAKAGGVYRVV